MSVSTTIVHPLSPLPHWRHALCPSLWPGPKYRHHHTWHFLSLFTESPATFSPRPFLSDLILSCGPCGTEQLTQREAHQVKCQDFQPWVPGWCQLNVKRPSQERASKVKFKSVLVHHTSRAGTTFEHVQQSWGCHSAARALAWHVQALGSILAAHTWNSVDSELFHICTN